MYMIRYSVPIIGRCNKRIISVPLSSLRPLINNIDSDDIDIKSNKKKNTINSTSSIPSAAAPASASIPAALTPEEYRKLHQVYYYHYYHYYHY